MLLLLLLLLLWWWMMLREWVGWRGVVRQFDREKERERERERGIERNRGIEVGKEEVRATCVCSLRCRHRDKLSGSSFGPLHRRVDGSGPHVARLLHQGATAALP